MSFWGAHEFRHNPKNRPPKKIPHEDCTAGIKVSGRGEDSLSRQPDFFTETAVTPDRKVEKSFPRWEINRHAEG